MKVTIKSAILAALVATAPVASFAGPEGSGFQSPLQIAAQAATGAPSFGAMVMIGTGAEASGFQSARQLAEHARTMSTMASRTMEYHARGQEATGFQSSADIQRSGSNPL